MKPARIYLDNAATSWPKPPAVLSAITNYYLNCGAAFGRGDHSAALQAGSIVDRCRQQIRQLFGGSDNDQVVMAHNGTDALNVAIHGLVRPGDHVVTTSMEHNSVLRPLYYLRDNHGVKLDFIVPNPGGLFDPEQFSSMVTEKTRLVCLTHASNVTGSILNVEQIVQAIRPAGAFVLLDVSQTAGKMIIDNHRMRCDILATAGHKGLFGPLGTGAVMLNKSAALAIRPWRQGGTGGRSELQSMPEELPWRLEAGNLDVASIAGLSAGIDFVRKTGIERIRSHDEMLGQQLCLRLQEQKGIQVLKADSPHQIAVCSLVFESADVHEMASILNANFGIEVRAGLHCAPLATGSNGGGERRETLRISPGWYNTNAEIDRVADAILEIIQHSRQ